MKAYKLLNLLFPKRLHPAILNMEIDNKSTLLGSRILQLCSRYALFFSHGNKYTKYACIILAIQIFLTGKRYFTPRNLISIRIIKKYFIFYY